MSTFFKLSSIKITIFPTHIHCKLCLVCPTTKMASVKPSIDSRVLILWVADFHFYQKPKWRYLGRQTIIQLLTFPRHDKRLNLKKSARLFNVETQFLHGRHVFSPPNIFNRGQAQNAIHLKNLKTI